MPQVPLFGVPAGPELLIILAIIVLLFGANKLPELARSSGQAMGEFNRGKLESAAGLEADNEDFDPLSEDEAEPEQ